MLKQICLFLFFLSAPAFLNAQTAKFHPLDAKDPLLGEWEWVKSDTSGMAAPLPDQDWQCFKFSAGTEMSFGALSYDADKGYACPTYFMAFTNGSQISGTASNPCSASDKGKKVAFTYRFEGTFLIITVRGENFNYRRRS